MSTRPQTLTSVKVDSEIFDEFRILCVKNKTSIQKLCDRSMHLFITDPEFRRLILNHNNLEMNSLEK